MKKKLFFYSVALLALSACTNDTLVDENTTVNQPKEIAIQALATPNTRAAVGGGAMPTTYTLKVAAFDATQGVDYFASTDFTYVNSQWTGSRYWPFTAATINFLAYTGFDNVTPQWNATPASGVALTLADNKTAQNDLMYACGTGTVSQSGNTLDYTTNAGTVGMTFKHAQAWIQFTVKAGDATSATKISVDSITLNDVACAGKFTVTHNNYNKTLAQRTEDPLLAGSVNGVWGNYSPSDIGAVKVAGYAGLSTSEREFGNLLVVPDQGIGSFTIHYTLDGNEYNYTYTPTAEQAALYAAHKHIFNITLTVHEILVAPEVENWYNMEPINVNI